MIESTEPMVTRRRVFGAQLCVPKEMTPEKAVEWYESVDPCGTSAGWVLDAKLGEVPCLEDTKRKHIVVHE